ncbi:MAG: hypothetical protein KGL69_04485 [Alphaproteobacteria bacterium]|nr:hypothetical protein [Alphaproteobacteria bacterium]
MLGLAASAALAAAAGLSLASPGWAAAPVFEVSRPAGAGQAEQGRLILLISKDLTREPRSHLSSGDPLDSPYVFGLNVKDLAPGGAARLDEAAVGFPVAHLSDLPPGDYLAQVVLNRYETFHLADGRVLDLPPDEGEGQHFEDKPGNLYSKPVRIHVGPDGAAPMTLSLDQVAPPMPAPKETPYVKYIRIRSERLSRFWGRDVYLSAYVLVPEGFATHPKAHYPLMVFHDHFVTGIPEFRTTPPDPDLKPDYSRRFRLAGYNRIEQQEGYALYKKWISPGFPRFLVVKIDHANPYYDDSYAVNSANLGPYGDAINYELIPAIEKRFRGLGQGWARFTYGGSTGGWEALATQVFYPDMYNGAFAACPDPIDFRGFTNINIYKDPNLYALEGEALKVEQPAERDYLGRVAITQRQINAMELARGDHSRSGEQYDIWETVFGPAGADGYPAPLFDKVTGQIDPKIAAYWRDHYDLSWIIARDWKTLAPKLQGKIHIYVGSADTYYLTDAVYYAQDRLEALKPAWGGEVAYGDRAEHCWNGDPKLANAYSRLHYEVQYLPKILARIKATAPKGADLTSWRY